MDSNRKPGDPGDFDALFSSKEVARRMRAVSGTAYDAAAQFWRTPIENGALPPRMKELILLAMHAIASSLNGDIMRRQIARALSAGASKEEIVDVMISISVLANHALYSSLPIFEEEWSAAGLPVGTLDGANEAFEAAKQRFIEIRGFWNDDRDAVARQMPDYFASLTDLSTESWARGPLTRKEREFICIAIDCTVTHTYGPGLRIHIRNAIREGASRAEILAIFQLAALMGLEGYVIAAEAMFDEESRA